MRARTRITVSRTTLSMGAAHRGDRSVDRLVDLALAELAGLFANRREAVIELLEPRRTGGALSCVQRLNVELTLRQGYLEQAVVADPQQFAELCRDGHLPVTQRPDHPGHLLSFLRSHCVHLVSSQLAYPVYCTTA